MSMLAVGRRRVKVGDDDPSLTPRAGLAAVAELDRVLGIGSAIDARAGRVKARRQGLEAGGLLVSLAETMLAGGDFMVDLDRQRTDAAGAVLRAVPAVPSSSTFRDLGKRFNPGVLAGVEEANGDLVARWFDVIDDERRQALMDVRPTIDLDTTDVEVYGRQKEGFATNHTGQLVGRPHVVSWAEAALALVADYGDGRTDPRPQAPGLIKRAVAALPGGLRTPIVRCDSGFFDGKVAWAAVREGCDFAIAAKRTQAVWRAARDVPPKAWRPAIDMAGTEVAECGYVPAGWPPGTTCIVRRTKVHVDDISGDSRSRRRRTMDPEQLALALDGDAEFVYAYTFIVTNLAPVWQPDMIEWWFRQRALIEELIKDAKLGAALRHLPSGYQAVNQAWMWAAILAVNISTWLQTICRTDLTDGRAHGKRLRHQILCICARVLNHSRDTVIRFPPGLHKQAFLQAWHHLRALPTWRPAGKPR